MKSWLWVGAAIIAAGVASDARAQAEPVRWTPFGADRYGEYFYDPQSVERLGGMIRYRMRGVVRPERPGAARSTLIRVQLNCAEQSLSVLHLETFDAAGRRLDAFTGDEALPRPERIQANSPEAALYRRLCPRSLVRPLPEPPPMRTVSPPPPMAPIPPPAAPVPSRPRPSLQVPAQLRIPIASLVTGDDYPSAALRAEEQGTVRVSLDVGPDGRVGGCTVTASSGSSILDAATCRILVARARFVSARNARGHAVADRFSTSITWSIPAEPEPVPPGEEEPAQPEQS